MTKQQDSSSVEDTVIQDIPSILPVLPLRDNVIFPYMIFPVLVGREQSIKAANYALECSRSAPMAQLSALYILYRNGSIRFNKTRY